MVCEKNNHYCSVVPDKIPTPGGNLTSLVSHWNCSPSGWDISVPTEHQDGFYLSHIPIPAHEKDEKRTPARRPHVGRTLIRDGIEMLK